jgi:hypothetical protein
MLSAMEYPHWLMVAGAALVVVGFIGFVFRQNRNGGGLERTRPIPTANLPQRPPLESFAKPEIHSRLTRSHC